MPPKRVLRKTQLTLDAFRKDASDDNPRSKNARSATCSPNPLVGPPASLPKPTAPVDFRPSSKPARSVSLPRPAPPQPPPRSSQDDAAWDLARTIYDTGVACSVNPSVPRPPYGDENCPTLRSSPQSNPISRQVESNIPDDDNNSDSDDDDEDFQNNPRQSTPTPRTRRRRSSIVSPPLRNDRPSMTRRSAKKSKPRVSLLQTRTLSLSEEQESNSQSAPALCDHSDPPADQSQVPLRVTALFAGSHSELSSDTDHEDRPIHFSTLRLNERPSKHSSPSNNHPQPLNLTCSPRQHVPSVPTDTNTPLNPAPSSPVLRELHVGVHAPRKEAARDSSVAKPVLHQAQQRICSLTSPTRKRGRHLVSLFNNDSLGSFDRNVGRSADGCANMAFPVSNSKDRPGSSKRVTPDPPVRHRLLRSTANMRSSLRSDSSDAENNEKNNSPSTPTSRPSVLKRRRVVCSSSSEDGCGSPNRKPMNRSSADDFRTPDHKRLLPEALRRKTPQKHSIADNSDIEIIGNTTNNPEKAVVSGEDNHCKDKSPAKRLTRRSGRLRSRAKSELFNLSQSESPSPPSTRKKGRFGKLQTRANSDDEPESGGANSKSHLARMHSNLEADCSAKGNGQANVSKPKEWYFERDIGQFSSSSSEAPDFKRTPFATQKHGNSGTTEKSRPHLMKPAAVERCIVAEFSDDENDFRKVADVESVGNSPTLSPPRPVLSSVEIMEPSAILNDAFKTEGADADVMDLIDVDDTADFDESHNHPSQAIQLVDSGEEVMEVDDEQPKKEETGPPPFNLHALCDNSEDLIAMMERLGEDHVLGLISKAQGEGRKIIGGEELGLDQTFNTDVFDKYSRTVVATEIGKDRSGTLDITEKALRGEYQFNYRGREVNASSSSRRGRGGKGRGRGRGRGRGFPYLRRKFRGGRRR